MKCKIRIRDIAVYHPFKVVNNEFYIEYFKKQGKDVRHLLENVFGRKERYIIDNAGKKESERENSLTMQVEAAKRVLEKANLTGQDIDGIIVATQFPEYMVPPSFMFVHVAIGGKEDCFGYDINCNCLGMTMAFQQASYYFMNNQKLEKILIVAGDYLNLGAVLDDEKMYGALGDCACAMIVERTKEDSELLDSDYFINNCSIDNTLFPKKGFSKMIENLDIDCLSNQVYSPECDIPKVIEKINELLSRNKLVVGDISAFCFSQYVKANNQKIKDALGIEDSKCPFVGDIYGYTGGCSPFLALNDLLENNKISRGDYILFWTLGSAMQHIFILIKY